MVVCRSGTNLDRESVRVGLPSGLTRRCLGMPDATPKKQGMGEGQKPVSKAYKDNWNDIFGKKKKR